MTVDTVHAVVDCARQSTDTVHAQIEWILGFAIGRSGKASGSTGFTEFRPPSKWRTHPLLSERARYRLIVVPQSTTACTVSTVIVPSSLIVPSRLTQKLPKACTTQYRARHGADAAEQRRIPARILSELFDQLHDAIVTTDIRRYCSGSRPAAAAHSSTKLSKKKVFCENPTLRQKVIGMAVCTSA